MIAYPSSVAPWNTQRLALLAGAGVLILASLLWPPLWVLAAVGCVATAVATLRYPVVGLCLLAVSVPWLGGLSIPTGSFSFAPTDLLIALVGGVWLARSVATRTNPFARGPWTLFIAVFLLAIILSATQAVDRSAAMREIVKWLELGVVYGAGTRLIESRRQTAWVLAAIIAGGVSQAFLGFAQAALHAGPAAFVINGGQFLRAFGTFDQPNPFAGYLNMTLPVALALALVLPRSPARFWSSWSAVVIALAVVVSASRGAFIAGFVAAVVVIAVARPGFRPWVWLGIFAAVLVAWMATYGLVPSGPVDKVLSTVGLGNVSFQGVTNATFSAVERAAHWLAGVRMFAAHPLLGVGIGNYADAYPAYHPRGWYAALEHAHNYYINIAAEAGIVGLVTYVLLAGSALWYSYSASRSARETVRLAAVLGVIGALIATDIHNLFDVLYVHGMVALLGLLMALTATRTAEVHRNEFNSPG